MLPSRTQSMAVSGRKAQIAFYGSDICFELILDIARDIGPGAMIDGTLFDSVVPYVVGIAN